MIITEPLARPRSHATCGQRQFRRPTLLSGAPLRTTPIRIERTTMKTTLLLSALAAGLMAVSTTTFAQNFVAYPQSYGSITQGVAPSSGFVAAHDPLTRSAL